MWKGGEITSAKGRYSWDTKGRLWAWSQGGDMALAIHEVGDFNQKKENSFFS